MFDTAIINGIFSFFAGFVKEYFKAKLTRNTGRSGEKYHMIKVVYDLFYWHQQNFKK